MLLPLLPLFTGEVQEEEHVTPRVPFTACLEMWAADNLVDGYSSAAAGRKTQVKRWQSRSFCAPMPLHPSTCCIPLPCACLLNASTKSIPPPCAGRQASPILLLPSLPAGPDAALLSNRDRGGEEVGCGDSGARGTGLGAAAGAGPAGGPALCVWTCSCHVPLVPMAVGFCTCIARSQLPACLVRLRGRCQGAGLVQPPPSVHAAPRRRASSYSQMRQTSHPPLLHMAPQPRQPRQALNPTTPSLPSWSLWGSQRMAASVQRWRWATAALMLPPPGCLTTLKTLTSTTRCRPLARPALVGLQVGALYFKRREPGSRAYLHLHTPHGFVWRLLAAAGTCAPYRLMLLTTPPACNDVWRRWRPRRTGA